MSCNFLIKSNKEPLLLNTKKNNLPSLIWKKGKMLGTEIGGGGGRILDALFTLSQPTTSSLPHQSFPKVYDTPHFTLGSPPDTKSYHKLSRIPCLFQMSIYVIAPFFFLICQVPTIYPLLTVCIPVFCALFML